jgi:hypothetical protein
MNSVDRFKKRKKIIGSISVYESVDKELVNEFLNSEVDENKVEASFKIVDEHHDFKYDFTVSKEESKEFLEQFKKDFNQERFDKLIIDCKKEVINSIVNPFGLGKIIAAYDKDGGNVNTIHNVRDGIYATESEKKAYDNKEAYNSDDYHKDTNYININKKYSENRKEGNAIDYMTGEKLDLKESHDLDHVKSAKEIHDDAGRVLAEIDGKVLANTDTNLKPTTATKNRSKKADDMQTFLAKKNERLKKMNELKSKNDLSPLEQNELKKLEELVKIDDKKALEIDKKAREEIDSKINKAYYTSGKFVKNTATASLNEGSKMGMQQAIGLVMTEFFTALFDEILDIYKNGFSNGFEDDRFFIVLKERLKNIALKIQAKWKDVAIAFKDGFLSGFISNLVTTAINMFVRTGKRVVRIIREGIYSLFRAVKMLIFPPENMTYEEAMHEAKKVIASGLIISLGVIAEQYIDTLIKGSVVLEPFSDILTTIFVGAITGLAVTMTVYYIDKKKNDKDAIRELIKQTDEKFENVEILLNKFLY